MYVVCICEMDNGVLVLKLRLKKEENEMHRSHQQREDVKDLRSYMPSLNSFYNVQCIIHVHTVHNDI